MRLKTVEDNTQEEANTQDLVASWAYKPRCTLCQWWCPPWVCLPQCLTSLSHVSISRTTSALAWNAVTKTLKSKWGFHHKTRTPCIICNGCSNRCTSLCMNLSRATRKCTLRTNVGCQTKAAKSALKRSNNLTGRIGSRTPIKEFKIWSREKLTWAHPKCFTIALRLRRLPTWIISTVRCSLMKWHNLPTASKIHFWDHHRINIASLKDSDSLWRFPTRSTPRDETLKSLS